jgi:uncharacterized membrane protein YhfC
MTMERIHSRLLKVVLSTIVFFAVNPHRFLILRVSKNLDTSPEADIPIRNPAKLPVS